MSSGPSEKPSCHINLFVNINVQGWNESSAWIEPQPSLSGRNKRSLLLCPICDAMGIKRTFGDESKLKTHFNLEHWYRQINVCIEVAAWFFIGSTWHFSSILLFWQQFYRPQCCSLYWVTWIINSIALWQKLCTILIFETIYLPDTLVGRRLCRRWLWSHCTSHVHHLQQRPSVNYDVDTDGHVR